MIPKALRSMRSWVVQSRLAASKLLMMSLPKLLPCTGSHQLPPPATLMVSLPAPPMIVSVSSSPPFSGVVAGAAID